MGSRKQFVFLVGSLYFWWVTIIDLYFWWVRKHNLYIWWVIHDIIADAEPCHLLLSRTRPMYSCFLPGFLDLDVPDDAFICRFLNTVDATALRATCREVCDHMARYRWCDIKSVVWDYFEAEWRACFPRAQGFLASEVLERVVYAEHESVPVDWPPSP